MIGLVLGCVVGCERQEIQIRSVSATASVGCSARTLTAQPAVNVVINAGIDKRRRFTASGDLTIVLESYSALQSGIGRTFRWVPDGLTADGQAGGCGARAPRPVRPRRPAGSDWSARSPTRP